MNFGTLIDKLIALVIVILLLSLVVQTVQSTFKKLLKIKSRQIEDSLLDLFQNALTGAAAAPRAGLWALLDASPVVQTVFAFVASPVMGAMRLVKKHGLKIPPVVSEPGTPERLRAEVLKSFGQLGRFAQSGRPMLDSLAKDDLLRVLARLEPKFLLGVDEAGKFLEQMQTAVDAVVALGKDLDALAREPALRDEASAQFGALRSVFTPLITDCRVMLAGDPPMLKSGVLAHDLFALRQIHPQDAMGLLANVQKSVQASLAMAKTDLESKALQELTQKLGNLAQDFGDLHAEFDAITAALRARIEGMERWFDTVMQSFDERFARSMKTWGLVIASCVVIALDANFFHIYGKISGSEEARNQIIAERETVQQRFKATGDAPAASPTATPATTLAESPTATPATPAEPPKNAENISGIVQGGTDEIRQEAALYQDLGFQPLSRAKITQWRNQLGKEGAFYKVIRILFGWFLTTLLLSAGAPFWEDALESLFGLKNLLRKGSDTRNVEERSGAGQPKT